MRCHSAISLVANMASSSNKKIYFTAGPAKISDVVMLKEELLDTEHRCHEDESQVEGVRGHD
jgi:hypothetical protein